jgi:hypothetical protein
MKTGADIPISDVAKAAGIVGACGLQITEDKKIEYIIIDPEIMDDDFIAKEARSFWILAKYFSKIVTNEPIPKTS